MVKWDTPKGEMGHPKRQNGTSQMAKWDIPKGEMGCSCFLHRTRRGGNVLPCFVRGLLLRLLYLTLREVGIVGLKAIVVANNDKIAIVARILRHTHLAIESGIDGVASLQREVQALMWATTTHTIARGCGRLCKPNR